MNALRNGRSFFLFPHVFEKKSERAIMCRVDRKKFVVRSFQWCERVMYVVVWQSIIIEIISLSLSLSAT